MCQQKCYPCYGIAPHHHNVSRGTYIGSTMLLDKEYWPKNFIEDPEAPGCGLYYCPDCMNGAPMVANKS